MSDELRAEIEGLRRDYDHSTEKIVAGDRFRTAMIKRADGHQGPHPWWHGWVIMDAFLAGVSWQEKRAYLAANPPDDPVTEGAVLSAGFELRYPGAWRLGDLKVTKYNSDGGDEFSLWKNVGGESFFRVCYLKTTNQLRSLIAALQPQPQGE